MVKLRNIILAAKIQKKLAFSRILAFLHDGGLNCEKLKCYFKIIEYPPVLDLVYIESRMPTSTQPLKLKNI